MPVAQAFGRQWLQAIGGLRHAQHRSAHFCPVSVMQPSPAVIPADLMSALKAECLTEAFSAYSGDRDR